MQNIIGLEFGKGMKVIDFAYKDERNTFWTCRCKCGQELVLRRTSITSAKPTNMCRQCTNKENGKNKIQDLTGQKFGRLTVLSHDYKSKKSSWLCKCDCGKETIVRADSLKSLHTQSCGCYNKDIITRDLIGYKWGDGCEVISYSHTDMQSYWNCRCGCGYEWVLKNSAITGKEAVQSCRKCFDKRRAIICTKDYTGCKFNRLTVVSMLGRKNNHTWCMCECDCGNECLVTSNALVTNHTMSCGCLFKELRARSGSDNPNWNHNLTDEERQKRRLTESYVKFIKTVLLRDMYKCKICNSNKKLEVHHLNSYHWDIENRENPDNGVTLCYCCHKDFHSKYGRKNNTKEQFIQYEQGNKTCPEVAESSTQ